MIEPRRLVGGAVVLVALTTASCGGRTLSTDTGTESELDRCETLCSDARDCPGVSASCTDDCGELVADAEAAGCAAALAAFLACAAGAPNVCNPNHACERSANAYAVCLTDYCYVHQASKACSGSF